MEEFCKLVDEMKETFDREYKDFCKDRKRWKSEFDAATQRANSSFNKIETLLNNCLNQNSINTQTLKLVLDAQMISQLVEK